MMLTSPTAVRLTLESRFTFGGLNLALLLVGLGFSVVLHKPLLQAQDLASPSKPTLATLSQDAVETAAADSPIAEAWASTFSKITGYSTPFQVLNDKFEPQRKSYESLLQDRQDLQMRWEAAQKDLQGISNLAIAESFRQVATSMSGSPLIQQRSANGLPTRRAAAAQTALQVDLANIQQGINQLNLAQRATVERSLKIVAQLEDNFRLIDQWWLTQRQMFDQYLELADLPAIRSKLELAAAQRELQQADYMNPGAYLALAVTQLRQGHIAEARVILNDAALMPAPVSQMAKAIRAELLARLQEQREAKKDLSEAVTLQTPAVLLLRARTLALLKEYKQSMAAWEKLDQSRQYDQVAKCGLALTRCMNSGNEKVAAKKARAESQLADELAGGKHWLCKITLAISLSRNGETTAAVTAAEQAAELALGNTRTLCLEIAEQIKAGQEVVWQF